MAAQHRSLTVWFTGLSASGKTTLCNAVYQRLAARGCKLEPLDGDTARKHLGKGLGFSREDRGENIRRIGFVAGLLTRNCGFKAGALNRQGARLSSSDGKIS